MRSLMKRPFRSPGTFRDEMDEFVNRFFPQGMFLTGDEGEFVPPMDVIDKKDGILVKAEIPGMSAEDIDISVTGNLLTIRGEKRHEEKTHGEGFVRHERTFGSFSRMVTLPCAVKTDKTEATCKSGVLEVFLPKADGEKSRKIEVKHS